MYNQTRKEGLEVTRHAHVPKYLQLVDSFDCYLVMLISMHDDRGCRMQHMTFRDRHGLAIVSSLH